MQSTSRGISIGITGYDFRYLLMLRVKNLTKVNFVGLKYLRLLPLSALNCDLYPTLCVYIGIIVNGAILLVFRASFLGYFRKAILRLGWIY
jgi:hypothetical protein